MPAKLIYSVIMSLDGFHTDADGDYAWGEPDEEVHQFINDLERPIGTYLYGRRMYAEMVYWESAHTQPEQSPATLDFAHLWRAADKIVYSRTLEGVRSARTRLEREFDPLAVRALKASATADITVSGPTLATHAAGAGLIDEYHVFLTPLTLGAGQPGLPPGARERLRPLDQHTFASGVVHLHYGAA
ncbi:dihydrofolate reductase family protein [Streptomyces profundus]|uniref:dihydrofolate reductase family protein n=1 Tax=Streptomyces profundus TaxID=2867410 RepID=UPI001D167A2E|nr:dihydrofolate reductase family protein [Streptomyces sp. MA3_2.13]UED85782.1 dihydrofolate reductase family protein [Streptomyces sp. MA3_2.13]